MATVGEWLARLAATNESEDKDSIKMQNLLHRLGFDKAKVLYGVVYLEGKGTIEAPPASIHSTAKSILQMLSNNAETI